MSFNRFWIQTSEVQDLSLSIGPVWIGIFPKSDTNYTTRMTQYGQHQLTENITTPLHLSTRMQLVTKKERNQGAANRIG
jgi:hypothetical protein